MAIKRNTVLVLLVAVFITVVALVGIERYFNTKEINVLVETALERDLSYELEIYNPITKSYSFEAFGD